MANPILNSLSPAVDDIAEMAKRGVDNKSQLRQQVNIKLRYVRRRSWRAFWVKAYC